jgi:hypothetical protein
MKPRNPSLWVDSVLELSGRDNTLGSVVEAIVQDPCESLASSNCLTLLHGRNYGGNSSYVNNEGPLLQSSGQSSWLQTQRSLVLFPTLPDVRISESERGPPSLVRIIGEPLERKK